MILINDSPAQFRRPRPRELRERLRELLAIGRRRKGEAQTVDLAHYRRVKAARVTTGGRPPLGAA